MIDVVVVDDHPIVRDGIVATLGDTSDIRVVGTGSTAAAAVELAARERPHVVVLDLELSDRSGLDIIVELGASRAHVVVFTAYGGEERIATALERGAAAYVLKGTPSDELIAAIRAAADGRSHLAPEVAAQLADALRLPRRLRVTAREREILTLVAQGLSNKAIAQRLNIAERTVKFHVGELLGRLGASNRAQAVVIAQARGLL
ncbi:MAG: response regulator transcription factor [Candidatus Eremiobacteraeota bacterium]|nr:response regulator transcription factor [Candidatus Eremiobacteraeota bacterium]